MEQVWALMPQVMEGLMETLRVFIVTLIISIPLGIVVAQLRLSKIKIVSGLTEAYIFVMRGTPLLLQIFFIFFGLPVLDITIDRFPAVILAFSLNYAAYFGEIFRAGINSIDKGQYEGAEVLGLSKTQTFFRIVLPQATKRILPAVSNEVTTLVKDTALVYVVGLTDLLKIAKNASNRDASILPFFVVAFVYLFIIGFITILMKRIEKRFEYYN
ncbi:MAG: amino acid ABC transporter permease [Clostridium sp.]